MKIVHIVGNRPQFIKLALLYKALETHTVSNIILHTGQHFDRNMSDIFFDELNIPKPSYTLGINNLTHNEMIGRMLMAIDPILNQEQPGYVIVYGDTNSTLAGAIAAKKRNISVAHIEAGVRTTDERMPEETNRYLTDRVSSLNFCCTYLGMENLEKEGYLSGIYNCGDLMLDASLFFKDIALKKTKLLKEIKSEKPFVLATIHREENTEDIDKLKNIIAALNNIHAHTTVVFPMHPKTRMIIQQQKIEVKFPVYQALGYLDLLALVQNCQSVITDSGGLSREAFFFKKPALVVMQHPFWPEIFLHGNCLPTNAITEEIITKHQLLISANKAFKTDIFGNGNAAEKISNSILSA